MPIERFFSIDLQTDAVCDFLRDHANPRYDAGFDSETWMAQGDYEDSGIRKELPNTDDETRNIRLHTAILKNYEIYDRQTQMQVAIGKTVTRVDHPLTLSLYALLLVRKRIDTTQRAAIEQAFQRYQPGIDDVDAVETALLIFEAAKGSAPLCRKRSMRPKGTTIQLEVRRRVAVSLLEAGWGVRHVARHVKASPSSVRRWRDAAAQPPDTGLDSKPHPGGSQPRLSLDQQQRLIELLNQGARAHGCRNELWTRARVASLIEQHFGISYCLAGVWHVLKRMGWSAQQPEKRAHERDEDVIADWPKTSWKPLKKSPTRATNPRLHG